MRWPWSRGKSREEVLLEFIREERAHSATLTARVLDVVTEQSKFMQRHLALFENAPEPQVRVMTDVDEAVHERSRALDFSPQIPANVDAFDPSSWAADLLALKNEIPS